MAELMFEASSVRVLPIDGGAAEVTLEVDTSDMLRLPLPEQMVAAYGERALLDVMDENEVVEHVRRLGYDCERERWPSTGLSARERRLRMAELRERER